MAKQITTNYSDNFPDAMHLTQEEFEKEASKAMAVKLFETNFFRNCCYFIKYK